jgi:hypothetical protein
MLNQSLKASRALVMLIAVLGCVSACTGPGITPAPNLVPGHQYPEYVPQGGG